jgi:hypothetical protein
VVFLLVSMLGPGIIGLVFGRGTSPRTGRQQWDRTSI